MVVLVALDDSFESQLLKSELTRDWLKPKWRDRNYLRQLQSISRDLRRDFRFNFAPDTPPGLNRPAIKVGSGPWEVLDKRIFRYSTLPLKSLCWYRDVTFMEDQGDWNYVCMKWESKVPQAPWLPAGEFPKAHGVIATHSFGAEFYNDDLDRGP